MSISQTQYSTQSSIYPTETYSTYQDVNHSDWDTTFRKIQNQEEITELGLNTSQVRTVDFAEFEAKIKNDLLKTMMDPSAKASDFHGNAAFVKENIMYPVPEGTQASQVQPYWNADNTSDRLVTFAMSFRDSFPDLSDEEFMETLYDAVLKGFAMAKEQMGLENIPPDLAQLYNDTFESTMSKLDALWQDAQEQSEVA